MSDAPQRAIPPFARNVEVHPHLDALARGADLQSLFQLLGDWIFRGSDRGGLESVRLRCTGRRERHVHELHVEGVRSRESNLGANPIGYYTLHGRPESSSTGARPGATPRPEIANAVASKLQLTPPCPPRAKLPIT